MCFKRPLPIGGAPKLFCTNPGCKAVLEQLTAAKTFQARSITLLEWQRLHTVLEPPSIPSDPDHAQRASGTLYYTEIVAWYGQPHVCL